MAAALVPPAFDEAEETEAPMLPPAFDEAEDTEAPLTPPAFDEAEDIPEPTAPASPSAEPSTLGKVFAGAQDIGKGFVRGVGGVISAAGGAVAMAPDTPGMTVPFLPKPIKDIYRTAGDWVTGVGKALTDVPGAPKTGTFEPGNPTWWAEKLPEVAPQLAAQIGLAAATKGASVLTFAGVGGAQMAGTAYNEAKAERLAKGEDEDTASKGAATEATIVGTIGAALESIPGAEYLTKGPIGNLVGKIVRSKVAAKAAVGGFAESLTETTQELTSIAAASGVRGKEFTADEIKQRLKAAGTLGAGAGLGAGALMTHANTQTTELATTLEQDIAALGMPSEEQAQTQPPLAPLVVTEDEISTGPAPAPVVPAQEFTVESGATMPSGKKKNGLTIFLGDPNTPLGTIEAERMPDGSLQVFSVNVQEDRRGEGHGLALYEKLIQEAGGTKIVSDSSVSPSAARVYDALEKRGYTIKRNPSRLEEGTENIPGRIVTDDGSPVFEVIAPPAPEIRSPEKLPVSSTKSAAPAEPKFKPTSTKPHIVSTAIQIEGQPLAQGEQAFEEHKNIAKQNPRIYEGKEAPNLNKQGGFMVVDETGELVFADRKETERIGKLSGQVPLNFKGTLHSQVVKPYVEAAVAPKLPQPTAKDWRSRNRFVGEDFAGPPNSVVVQVRDLNSTPVGEPITIPPAESMEATAASVFSGFEALVNSRPNASLRETLVKVLDANGKSVAQLRYTPNGMEVAEQGALDAARANFKASPITPAPVVRVGFHGTREKIEGALRPGIGKNARRFLHEEGIWFAPQAGKDFDTSSVAHATRYSGDSGTIVEAELTLKKPYFGDVDELVAHKINAKWLREHGYDGFVDDKSGSGFVAVLNPSQIREIKRTSSAPQVQPAPVVPSVSSHLRTSPAVQSILTEQTTAEPAMKEPAPATEGGAIFGAGGKRPATSIGVTPRGDKNWIKIPAWYKRAGKGLFTEGARGVLIRSKNKVAQVLAKATRQHVDLEQELYGQNAKILENTTRHLPAQRLTAANAEVAQYVRDKENARTPARLLPDAQKILDAWYKVWEETGDVARANNVQVFDAKTGGYRTIGKVPKGIPRMFSTEVERALNDPDNNEDLFKTLVQALATHRGITPEAADAELQRVSSRFSKNDFHGNLELARGEQLPEIFYEYNLANIAARYLPAYAERMAQIISYGQRLGPRDAPIRKNLWDIAREEARPGGETQQWLNEAEDQATGFKPKTVAGTLAKRAQAIGNAALLSDPTTTVVRNLLSGLSVTTERFGVGRSLRQLVEAGKSASRANAREMGAVRDDIGSFLGAEQLGTSDEDNFIRELQQIMLKVSGFSGSETFVRTHNALVASSFARDAAISLDNEPTSRLSKEALAHFKRWDIDPEAIVAEKGNWKTGSETRKFIRTAVRESQGGYKFDQVPLWAGTGVGRFLYQYGRWGVQRANDIFKNTIAQARGEKVSFRGKQMTSRNVLPLMRLGLFTAGLGEAFAAIASLIFDRDRRDATFNEIGEAWKESELKAVGMFTERMVNDILMAGTFGLIAQGPDWIKSFKDQSRLKNPAEPPSLFGVRALTDLAKKAYDQNGSLTNRDWMDAATQTMRGPVNVSKVVKRAIKDPLYAAQNDTQTLRSAARRWAKEAGHDAALRRSGGDFDKSVNAPTFEPLQDALMVGDSTKAAQIADKFIASQKDEKKARAAIKTSVKGRQPFRVGSFVSPAHYEEFIEWAEKNLPADDLKQIKGVQDRYVTAAQDADLW